MQIEKVKIADLQPYKLNAKQHPKKQIEQIKKSIQEFGFNDPIAIDEKNSVIEGHGRLQALKEIGEIEVDAIRLSHLTEEQKRAYILVHNQLTMETGFDKEILKMELSDILDIDMSDFGFELPEEMEIPDYKAETQELKENILNLAVAQYPGVGSYDTPRFSRHSQFPRSKNGWALTTCFRIRTQRGRASTFSLTTTNLSAYGTTRGRI